MNQHPQFSDSVVKAIEEGFELRREALVVLDLIVAEFNSDPMSVQCFDLRTVKRAQEVMKNLKALSRRCPQAVPGAPWGGL